MTVLLRGLIAFGLLTVGLVLGLSTAPVRDEAPEVRAPSPPPAFVADRLFLGRAIPGGGSVSEEEWATFLREVVTPRFPEGLTVWRAEGQWTDSSGRLIHETVMILEVFHPAGSRAESSLAAIVREYKSRFRQGAVLRVSTPALGELF